MSNKWNKQNYVNIGIRNKAWNYNNNEFMTTKYYKLVWNIPSYIKNYYQPLYKIQIMYFSFIWSFQHSFVK